VKGLHLDVAHLLIVPIVPIVLPLDLIPRDAACCPRQILTTKNAKPQNENLRELRGKDGGPPWIVVDGVAG
jgi:hypothetical protein